ncbi:nitroreductase family protein [Candidatus Contubernalis alkaliaceticus]|uniref:nitroreductase family protein n=1 Tax=Candidatus Contubernalis alkaliaceticus TaxID=338645 RepID=UPI001F4C25A9|nr:nitroreductase family protein [Candidatus Contubernalis alkalaceticus]
MKAIEIIQKRRSVRTYSNISVGTETKEKLEKIFEEHKKGPFNNIMRFRLLDLGNLEIGEMRKLGTYGVIKGAKLYILAAVKEGTRCMEDVGYCMEHIILKATSFGLGTCWLAGTFKRSSFAEQMQLSEDELLPAIIPVGYPAEKAALVERMMRFGVKARHRKPWEELFFKEDGKTPLRKEDAGNYKEVLEAVRLGPSATNRQPWRVIKDNKGLYHLYLQENSFYNRALGKIRLQNIDMGIAMCHFELAAGQLGIKGRWQEVTPGLDLTGLDYIVSWV